LTDNMDGTFTLAIATNSGNNNAVFINSSDGGTVSTLLERALIASDVVTVSRTISLADIDYRANGVEFGLHSNTAFRLADAPDSGTGTFSTLSNFEIGVTTVGTGGICGDVDLNGMVTFFGHPTIHCGSVLRRVSSRSGL